ncbi:hypothetical protein H3N56_11250 [Cetobacterium sp. 2A]|uniref:COG1470 family protein n=1 Tax=Cetobacterium sp. 2A TaxID=2754723 RepID=UPI00163CAE19|nr:hypothetical protein [Cetobacterium sp. 2A]MBC2857009.1 hypothetical protein [Cetobacterium sp. 2A]
MKKVTKLLIFIIFGLKAFAYMQVAPLIFDKRIDEGATEEFYITNQTDQEVGYRIYKEKSDNGLDMTPYMDFYPKSLKLKSGQSEKVKVYIEAPKDSEIGEYTTIMGIKEINIPETKKSGGRVVLYTDLKLELAGYVGNLKPEIAIRDIVQNGELIFEISNTGKTRIKVEAYLESDNEKETKYIDSFRLLKGSKKSLNQKIDIKNLKNPKLVIRDMEGNKLLEKGIGKQ